MGFVSFNSQCSVCGYVSAFLEVEEQLVIHYSTRSRQSVYALLYLYPYILILIKPSRLISLMTACGKILRGMFMYLYCSIGVWRQESFKSIPRNLPFGVDIILLNSNSAVTIPALGVYVFPGQSILFLPTEVCWFLSTRYVIGGTKENNFRADQPMIFFLFPLIHFSVSFTFISCLHSSRAPVSSSIIALNTCLSSLRGTLSLAVFLVNCQSFW